MLTNLLLLGVMSSAQGHYFTVRDSIEMARFDRDNPTVKFSPDNRSFAIVTSRGILQSDTIESTIWVFKTDAVRAFLQPGNTAPPPIPKAAVRWQATPELLASDSYKPVISNLQWLPDSKTILFLAQNSRGERQLHTVDLVSGLAHTLTPQDYDVDNFAWTPRFILYEATPSSERIPTGDRINADASDITDMPRVCVLFPKNCSIAKYGYLWMIRNGKSFKVTPLRFLSYGDLVGSDVISVSPDARNVIVLPLVDAVLPAWGLYEPAFPEMRIDPKDPHMLSPLWNSSLLTQYTLVNLRSGASTPLVNAPNGFALGWGGSRASESNAVWSPDGKRLLLMNTFLPLEGVNATERAKRLHPCDAAMVDVASKQTSCVTFKKYTAHTDASSNAVPLSIVVKQSLNVPPTLWVVDTKTKKMKKLLDPNPQLAGMNLGEASVFRWKDTNGYAWIAGLVKPPDYVPGKRYPLVIQTHGFDPNEFMSDGSFTTAFAARPLASAGIIVLQMDSNHKHEPGVQEASDQIRGFESAIAVLGRMGLIDPKKVGIIGFSRTCYYVESALVDNPMLFAAASITDGVDFGYSQYLSAVGSPGFLGEYDLIYGTRPHGAGLAAWLKEAPDFHLDRVRTPLRIEALSPDSALGEWEIFASLRMQQKPVDFSYIPEGQHILQKPLERMASQQGNVDWFRFWLQGYEDPDPAKAAQYRRWETLRS